MSLTEVLKVDYANTQQGEELVDLLNAYACDVMGGGEPLSEQVRKTLVAKLAQVPGAFSFMVRVNGQAAGLINCFMGFSTFSAQPLVNIHDLVVLAECRGLGLSQMLLSAVEQEAQARGCCKVTLEVLSENLVAKKAYLKAGFAQYSLDERMGHAEFWQKNLH